MLLILKLLLVPSLIYLVTLSGRRWGAQVAGWFSAFPIVSGPILLVIALEQGSQFGAAAALGTLFAVIPILVFSLAYAWASARFGVVGSQLCALMAYGLALALMREVELGPWMALILVFSTLLIAPMLFPAISPRSQPARKGRDLPWRMVAAAALVLAVTTLAAQLGPRMSGLLAMFPVMSTVLVGFSHYYSGRSFAVDLLRGMVYGYYAFAVFCLVLALSLVQFGLAAAFSGAFAAALIVQWLAGKWMQHKGNNG